MGAAASERSLSRGISRQRSRARRITPFSNRPENKR